MEEGRRMLVGPLFQSIKALNNKALSSMMEEIKRVERRGEKRMSEKETLAEKA